jgi:prepilin-type processing-associated H-X9-DG protein
MIDSASNPLKNPAIRSSRWYEAPASSDNPWDRSRQSEAEGLNHSSAINIGYVDGHSSKIPLQKLRTVYSHVGYVPADDVWRTSP